MDLTGNWQSANGNNQDANSDNGMYTLQQVGNELFVYGSGKNQDNTEWKNIGYGKIDTSNNTIEIRWCDSNNSKYDVLKHCMNIYRLKIEDGCKKITHECVQSYSFGNWEKT